MIERVVQKAALIGQAVEDLTYMELSPDRFTAELLGTGRSAQYKAGGFFIFSDLRPGAYTLRLAGRDFRPEEHGAVVEAPSLLNREMSIFGQAGDNELFLIVKTVHENNNAIGPRITFDPLILTKEIRAGARVLGAGGFETELAADLEARDIMQARLASVTGLTPGSILRIVRGRSCRLKFNPYHQFASELTRIVGQVVRADAPEMPLEGAKVRLTQVNDVDVVLNEVQGVSIHTLEVGGTEAVLGAEKDIATYTNHRGDYNLYFRPADAWTSVSLAAALSGYQPETTKAPVEVGRQNKLDFQLRQI